MGIPTRGDGSTPEKGSTESPQREVDPLGRSVTVPFAVTVEFDSDLGTTLRTGHAATRLGAGRVEEAILVEEPGSDERGSMDPSDLESAVGSVNGGVTGSSESAPRADPIDRAKIAFATFSLSRFTPDTLPENFVARDADPTSVLDKQRARFTKEIESLDELDVENSGMRLSFRLADKERIRNALPGLGSDNAQIDLAELLALLKKNMSGTDFRSVGNLALRPLTAEQQLQDRAQAIIDRIKASGETSKAGGALASGGGEHTETDEDDVR